LPARPRHCRCHGTGGAAAIKGCIFRNSGGDFGQPAYARQRDAPSEITTGAEDGSEWERSASSSRSAPGGNALGPRWLPRFGLEAGTIEGHKGECARCFTRLTFKSENHYHSVEAAGRVDLDSDWNEQDAITSAHRDRDCRRGGAQRCADRQCRLCAPPSSGGVT
jgi:hypothetical protein